MAGTLDRRWRSGWHIHHRAADVLVGLLVHATALEPLAQPVGLSLRDFESYLRDAPARQVIGARR